MRGRGLSKEGGGPVAVNHSLTFCCVKTLSNTHRIECASLIKIYKFQSTMDRIVNEYFFRARSSFRINAASFVSLPHSRTIDN